jgi:superfamily II DNA or RNA helicase
VDKYGHEYDIVVIDEAHHVAKKDSEYQYVLTRCPAPIRLGLTATTSPDLEAQLICEGLIGPILGQVTINQGTEDGRLAKPRIKIHKLEKDYKVNALRKYAEVYNAGIVDNLARNLLIAQIVKSHADKKESVLVMIDKLEQGHNIQEQLSALKIPCEFVRGATKTADRMRIKRQLNDGEIYVVICSSVWVEGVNIPNLKAVVAAAGGKSEIKVLQSVGRGLRKTDDKDEVWIHDFFDPSHKFLIEHFGERLIIYLDNEWL